MARKINKIKIKIPQNFGGFLFEVIFYKIFKSLSVGRLTPKFIYVRIIHIYIHLVIPPMS